MTKHEWGPLGAYQGSTAAGDSTRNVMASSSPPLSSIGGSSEVPSTMAASSIILFKTGYSFISVPVLLGEEGVEGGEGVVEQCHVGPLPPFAVHGTVGLQPWQGEEVQVLSLAHAPREPSILARPTGADLSMAAFMAANLGRRVALTLGTPQGPGTGGLFGGGRGAPGGCEGRVKWVQEEGEGARLAVVEVRHGEGCRDRLVDCSNILEIESSQEGEAEGREGSLVARYRRAVGSAAPRATLSYLTRGLTWAPTYILLLHKEEMTLSLEGSATILCDLPSFTGLPVAKVSLVAGQPRILLDHLCDPLASGTGAMHFVNELSAQNSARTTGRSRNGLFGASSQAPMMAQQIAPAFGFGGSGGLEQVAGNQEVEGITGGEMVEDFYHYQLESVPVAHNGPVKVPFLQQCLAVPYEDVYSLDLDQAREGEGGVEVKHAISLTNPTGQPLTTGPVSVLARDPGGQGESRFMVQSMLKYSGPGKPIIVEITRALDVEATYSVETATERTTELWSAAVSWTGAGKKYVDVITKKGKLTIRNPKKIAIKCKVEHTLEGHLKASEPAVREVTERPTSGHQLNPLNRLLWEVEVPASASTSLTIDYNIKVWK